MRSATQSLTRGLGTFFDFIPQLIGAIVILIVGYIVAKILQAVGFDGWMKRSGIKQFFDRAQTNQTPATILGKLVFWFVFIIAITMATDAFGIRQVSEVLAQLIAYIPNIIAAVLILLGAVALAAAIAFGWGARNVVQDKSRERLREARPGRRSSSRPAPRTSPPPAPCAAKSRPPENRHVRQRGPYPWSHTRKGGRRIRRPPRFGRSLSLRCLSSQCFRQRSPICARRPVCPAAIVHGQGKRPRTAKRKRVEMNNLYIERSLNQMHQEDLRREVRANRAASRLRAHRERGSFLQSFPGLFSLSLKRA